MKTKFSVDIHAYSSDNSFFLEVIAKHNEGSTFVNGNTFLAYQTVNNVKYTSASNMVEVREEDSSTWQIFSGQKHILTITEKTFIGSLEDENETTKANTYDN